MAAKVQRYFYLIPDLAALEKFRNYVNEGNTGIGVSIDSDSWEITSKVVSVNITWGSMDFTYTDTDIA